MVLVFLHSWETSSIVVPGTLPDVNLLCLFYQIYISCEISHNAFLLGSQGGVKIAESVHFKVHVCTPEVPQDKACVLCIEKGSDAYFQKTWSVFELRIERLMTFHESLRTQRPGSRHPEKISRKPEVRLNHAKSSRKPICFDAQRLDLYPIFLGSDAKFAGLACRVEP